MFPLPRGGGNYSKATLSAVVDSVFLSETILINGVCVRVSVCAVCLLVIFSIRSDRHRLWSLKLVTGTKQIKVRYMAVFCLCAR